MANKKYDSKSIEKEERDGTNERNSKPGAKDRGRGKQHTRNGSDGSRSNSKIPTGTDRLQFEAITAPTGRAFNFSRNNKLGAYLYTIPGIIRYTFTPTVGQSLGSTSPFNASLVALQNQMRAVGKYNRAYDSNDIGMYAVAITSYSTFVTWLKNVYHAYYHL